MARVTSSSAQCCYGLGAGVREEGDASHCPGSLQDCCLAMTPCPQALFMLGVMLGSYIFGWLSDRWGRKLSFFLSLILQVRPSARLLHTLSFQTVFGVLSGLVQDYWIFVFLRLVVRRRLSGQLETGCAKALKDE